MREPTKPEFAHERCQASGSRNHRRVHAGAGSPPRYVRERCPCSPRRHAGSSRQHCTAYGDSLFIYLLMAVAQTFVQTIRKRRQLRPLPASRESQDAEVGVQRAAGTGRFPSAIMKYRGGDACRCRTRWLVVQAAIAFRYSLTRG